jgi:hypothetical protein
MDLVGNVLPQVLKDEASEDRGEMARLVDSIIINWWFSKVLLVLLR